MATAQQVPFKNMLTGRTAELSYIIDSATDDQDALTEMLATAPTTYFGLLRKDFNAEVEEIADNTYAGRVPYGTLATDTPQLGVGESSFSFDTGGGQEHITQSLATTSHGTSPPSFGGAIGVTSSGVEGVDVVVPVYSFAETHVLTDAAVDTAYKTTLFSLTGKVNNASFKGLAAGECLFLGASGSKRSDDNWEVTYRFAARPNLTGLSVGSISGIAKGGWEYLWTFYEETESSNTLVRTPKAAYVEQVYESGDFSALGIGT